MPSVTDDMQSLAARLVEPLRGWFLGYGPGYEAGSWTPSLGGSTADGTISYSAQTGTFVRIGTVVILTIHTIFLSSVTSAPTGNLLIRGLPFAARSGTYHFSGYLSQYNALNLTAGCVELGLRLLGGTSALEFVENFDNTGASLLPGSAISASTVVAETLIYEMA